MPDEAGRYGRTIQEGQVTMSTIDETTLLRFASGELDSEEESGFLARCEATPGAWREAALAVAEHRRVVEALGELADEAPIPSVAPSRRRGAWSTPALAIAALAAGLLIGIATAHLAGLGNPRGPQVVQTPAPTQAPSPVATSKAASPVVEPSAVLAPRPVAHSPVPTDHDDYRRAVLARHGFEVQEEPTVYVITTANGTHWTVPTQRTTLHYVKH
jgi:hypothetical protein